MGCGAATRATRRSRRWWDFSFTKVIRRGEHKQKEVCRRRSVHWVSGPETPGGKGLLVAIADSLPAPYHTRLVALPQRRRPRAASLPHWNPPLASPLTRGSHRPDQQHRTRGSQGRPRVSHRCDSGRPAHSRSKTIRGGGGRGKLPPPGTVATGGCRGTGGRARACHYRRRRGHPMASGRAAAAAVTAFQ